MYHCSCSPQGGASHPTPSSLAPPGSIPSDSDELSACVLLPWTGSWINDDSLTQSMSV